MGGSFEFSLFSSLSIGFKYPVSAVCILLWLSYQQQFGVKQCLNKKKNQQILRNQINEKQKFFFFKHHIGHVHTASFRSDNRI